MRWGVSLARIYPRKYQTARQDRQEANIRTATDSARGDTN